MLKSLVNSCGRWSRTASLFGTNSKSSETASISSTYCCRRTFKSTVGSSSVPKAVAIPGLTEKETAAILRRKEEVGIIQPVEDIIKSDPSLQSPDYFQVHNLFTIRDLMDARVHLGHKMGNLHDRMKPFVFGHRFDTVIFDLDKTAFHLRQALNFMAHIAYRNGIILFVSRSPATMHMVEKTAMDVGEFAHTREWETAILANSTSKFGGQIRLPDLIVFMSTLDNVLAPHVAVKDAAKMMIPSVGVVDSNCDPSMIAFPIPGNDDTPSAVQLYCNLFKEAIRRGKEKRQLHNAQQKKLMESSSDQ